MRHHLRLFTFALMVIACGCSKKAPSASEASPAGAANKGPQPIDACSLLTSKELETIQGAPLQATKPSSNTQGGLTISQCYYQLPTATDSVVITITQRAADKGRDPKEAWAQIFHHEKRGNNDEEKETPLEPITNLGDEAFWLQKRFGGKLYILKGNTYVTIGLGSTGDEPNKIEKAKALAEVALKKLP